MKKPILYPKSNAKKNIDTQNNKKTTPIDDNNNTILNFFKVSSLHKSTSIIQENSPKRQIPKKSNQDKTDKMKDYRLSKFNFYQSKKKKRKNSIQKLLKKMCNDAQKNINISNYIFFTKNYSEKIKNIFENNFIRNFKRYLDNEFINDRKKIGPRQDLNISKNSFNKFIQQNFQHFIIKYLLNTYHDLIYVSEEYMTDEDRDNNDNEVELLSYIEKPNIYLEYSPININESNLFYPELSSAILKFIKKFRKKRWNKKQNCALLLYRPKEDFNSFISKIRLVCDQMGYNLLVKEDETNKLMAFEKLRLINQNYIIGSLKEKNKKYLQIIESASKTPKWLNFLESNNIYSLIEQEDKNNLLNNKTQTNNNRRNQKLSKSQSTINTTQALSKRLLQTNKNKNDDSFSNTILTFIGHNSSEEIGAKENNENNNSKEYIISKNYQQNVLEKFNKRKNLVLFVDNFDDNEENCKYINQINALIPNSRSPIIILTNNLYRLVDALKLGNSSFHKRYMQHQIENEGIIQKENVIYMTFLIIYFFSFFPKAELERINKNNNDNNKNNKDNNKNNNLNNNEKEKKEIPEIQYKNDELNLDKIKKVINDVFIDTKLNNYNNKLYSSLISLSYIIAIINNYELDNILVFLKNLFLFIDILIKRNNVKQTALNTITLLENKVLEEIEEYQVNDDIDINYEDLEKLNDICEQNSFSDYELGIISKAGEKQYEAKMINYGINEGIDYNKESYFYINEFFDDYKKEKLFNFISNEEINQRIIEDHKFYQNYYSSAYSFLNRSDIIKINIILTQIIYNENISLEDISRFIGTRHSKRNNSQNENLNSNNNIMKEKINILNKIFRKCPFDLFNKYINAHIGLKYYIEFICDNKKYFIPDKLVFHNYFNDYVLFEQLQSEGNDKYLDSEEDEDEALNEDEENYDEDESH